ncbi:MAG: hypothetical protein IJW92_03225 [Clostridia bacterium]|nr:hypothetical protein [Clostridia bacterium]
MKKLVSMLLAVSMCICVCIALTACGGSSAKFEYELSDDGSYYIITDIEITEKTEVLDIPAEYDGKPVKAIMSWTTVKNNHSSNLKEINIPNSIRFIKWLSIDEGCVVNFGDYSNNLVPTSTFDFPQKNNIGELDYNNLAQHTFYEFSVIIAGISASSPNSGTITFPENVVFAGNDVNTYFEKVFFAGKVSTYQKGNAENGWDDVTTKFLQVNRSKTVEIPEVAVGKGYDKINVHLPTGGNYVTENLIVSDSVRSVMFSTTGEAGEGQLNLYFTGEKGFESTFSSSKPGNEFPTYLIKDYYYSETQPTDTSVAYWHYVDSVPTPW